MSLSSTFDISRVTNLENRLNVDEAILLANNDTAVQQIHLLNVIGNNNALNLVNANANTKWLGIMNDTYTYTFAMGQFAANANTVELRAYLDQLTIRTGRSAAATNADFTIVTNDSSAANISQNINLQPNVSVGTPGNILNWGETRFYPRGKTVATGLRIYYSAPFYRFASTDPTISDIMLSFGQNYLGIRNTVDGAWMPINASAFTVSSMLETKENINEYGESALEKVKNTRVKQYTLKEHTDDQKYLGLIMEESPEELQHLEGINLYSMCSMLWKAVQELSQEVQALKAGK
jgi:hypothetical protein